ncbi:MAG: hypothetical protein JSS61_00040 [Verrucomicrobia bacterium]|nr:hypothetical protein [Verrucomicrobiota bacterium]
MTEIRSLLFSILALPIPLFSHSPTLYARPELEQYRTDQLNQYLLPGHLKVEISNWLNPSHEDYLKLQEYLEKQPRPELKFMNLPYSTWREERVREFTFAIEETPPEFHVLHMNQNPSSKKNCIVTYISYNKSYRAGLTRLLSTLKSVGFNGDVVYRIGGWPYVEEGSLEYFDVPYAFKVFALLEAKKLGYQNCLWMDVSLEVLKPIDPLFEHLDRCPVYFQIIPGFSNANHIHEMAVNALGFSLKGFLKIPPITATVVGINCHHPLGIAFLDSWHQILKNKVGFLSHIPEQAPLSAIARNLYLFPFAGERKHYAYHEGEISEETILLWARESLHLLD